ncbi:MAG: metallophosphoesterase family protein, partial [Phaeodactylibacter sp.]|nr:metallophosphoesterase family protein [Phaeodactylibacter sp.]
MILKQLNIQFDRRLFSTGLITCLVGVYAALQAQTITIQPYLQDVSPHEISILWETDAETESVVEWGLSDTLGNTATGSAYTSNGTNMVHEVQLDGLERFTQYFYRVKTGAAQSEIYSFKTPPFASDHEPFRIVAMSDMQRDGNFPNKFQEIVEEGVLDYLETSFGGELIDNLALVMIPGDLVDNGNSFDQWRNTFFNPAEQLFSRVPVYPVLGNHENNSAYYFTYFKLPENGTPGFEEHWWIKDYGNVRMIGLNSNGAFAIAEQLDWLDTTLSAACDADSIDFVFAQLHHPHKSELWTPGESDFTGEVIARLEQFSADCGKPSIHFFGHTHGYSRGQSRDHKHLWINVATAGGAIDNWGEFPNFDYDEFSVSQDEYGFVLVEISDDPEPTVTVKRIGRGDQDAVEDNVLRDEVTIRLTPSEVQTPEPLFPKNEEVAPECVNLQATAFASHAAGPEHGQSHWQVTTFENGFNEPVFESWKNFENWYFEIDTQAGDDLTDEQVEGLAEFTTYIWRVRYRDKEMNWSDWSVPTTFTTGASIAVPNLLLNPGAEQDLSNWTTLEGVVEALESGVCNGVTTHSGEQYFAVGGLCEHSPVGRAMQAVDVSSYADSIDTGAFPAHFGGYLSDYSGADLPEMKLLFLDADALVIGESQVLSTLNNSWTLLSAVALIPAQTRTIQMELKGTRNQGTDNDSYFDDLFLMLGADQLDCSTMPLRTVAAPLQVP